MKRIALMLALLGGVSAAGPSKFDQLEWATIVETNAHRPSDMYTVSDGQTTYAIQSVPARAHCWPVRMSDHELSFLVCEWDGGKSAFYGVRITF